MEHLWSSGEPFHCLLCEPKVYKTPESEGQSCPHRPGAPPRPRPASFMDDPGAVGARMREIMRESGKSVE